MYLQTDEGVAVHVLTPTTRARMVRHCRTCKCKRRVVASLYYDVTYLTCTACGEDPLGPPARFRKITFSRAGKIARAKLNYASATTWKQAIETLLANS